MFETKPEKVAMENIVKDLKSICASGSISILIQHENEEVSKMAGAILATCADMSTKLKKLERKI